MTALTLVPDRIAYAGSAILAGLLITDINPAPTFLLYGAVISLVVLVPLRGLRGLQE